MNLPFYIFAIKKKGWNFTIKTFISIFLVSVFSEYTPKLIELGEINPFYASIFGGFIIGTGILMLFRHNSSLGGVNILAIYLQDNYNISAGKFQILVDSIIVLSALFIVGPKAVLFSVLAIIALNLILAVNHKPGRCQGMS